MNRFCFLLIAGLLAAVPVRGQELAPELQFGARAVVSGNVNVSDGEAAEAVSDFSDTAVLTRARQKLFNDWRGQFVVGFQFPDAESDLGQVYFHRVFVRLQNRRTDVQMGRTRLSSTLGEFPTLRDDDAIAFTDVLSPFSSGTNSQDSQFGNVIEGAYFFTPRLRLGLHGEHYAETARLSSDVEESFGLNAAGVSLVYRVPETQRWNRHVVDQVGLAVDGFFVDADRSGLGGRRFMPNVKGAFALNLVPDPVHLVRLSHQTILNAGVDGVDQVDAFPSLSRARSVATFTTVDYTWRRYEWPTLRTALGVGYKRYPDLDEPAGQWTALGNVFYRLGANFDVGVQVQHRWGSDRLLDFGEQTTSVRLALVYSFDQVFNNQFDDRDSILNLEHGYIE